MHINQIKRSMLFFLLLLGISTMANAAIISGTHTTSGGKNVDLQGLEWLSLDHTQDLSRNTIEAFGEWTDTFGTTWSDSDWRYATRWETEALLGSLWGGVYNGWSNDNADGAQWFLDNFEGLGFDTGFGVSRVDGKLTNADVINLDTSVMFFGADGECHGTVTNNVRTCAGRVIAFENANKDFDSLNINTKIVETAYTTDTGAGGWFDDEFGGSFGVSSDNFSVDKTFQDFNAGSLLVRESITVPEPSTLILIGLGLAGLGFSRRKRFH